MEIIDLTSDQYEEPHSDLIPSSAPTPKLEERREDGDLSQNSSDILDTGQFYLAEDESKMTIRELLECLTADELKKLTKQMKLKLTANVCLYRSIA